MTAYGAKQEDWFMWRDILGLGGDMLPVVSNTKATISEKSSLKALGKVPSVWDRRRKVVGLSGWTQKVSGDIELDNWQKESDYGFCIQTRYVRAFDIDVTDRISALSITNRVKELIGAEVGVRYRRDSGKCLIAVRASGTIKKQRFEVEGGVVELLGNGQQFVAHGTHPDGYRYRWEDEGKLPIIEESRVVEIMAQLHKEFGTGDMASASGARVKGETVETDDPIVDQLTPLDYGQDGAIYIECPFKHEHSMDSGYTETAYFPAGSNGYEQGHFKCLHAHCMGRSDDEFMQGLGVTAVGVEAFNQVDVLEPDLPSFERQKDGAIKPLRSNVRKAVERPDLCNYQIAFDDFTGDVMVSRGNEDPRRLRDTDYTRLCTYLEEHLGFKNVATATMREVVEMVAEDNVYDSAKEWVDKLVWDGVPRIDRFCVDYLGCEETPLALAAGRYMFTALSGRALQAGIKADMCPILIGKQGALKSSVIAAMSPKPEWFGEIGLTDDETNRARQLKGKMLAEIGEMRGLWGNTIESIKNFIAKPFDEWVPKYREQPFTYKRRCMFVGTSNHYEILNDTTGNRRFVPLEVGVIDIEAVRRDCVQLWAEGRAIFYADGIQYRELEKLLSRHNDKYTIEDPWCDAIRNWLETEDLDGLTPFEKYGGVSTSDILSMALGHSSTNSNSGNGKRVAELMRYMGYTKAKLLDSERKRGWYWVEPE